MRRAVPCRPRRPFTDVQAHIEGNRELVAERVAATVVALERRAADRLEVVPLVYGEDADARQRPGC